MHIIPQSWSHLHILVSVFPSFGLLFVLCFYLSGLYADNKGVIRTCLLFFIGLALLALPTYLSGIRAVEAFPSATKLAKDTISFHNQWGMTSLVALILTGVIAAFELWRSYRTDVSSKVTLRLVLGLAIVSLGLMIYADGWEINHSELRVTVVIPDVSTPPWWPHVHMIINHFPTVGFVFAIAFLLVGLATRNDLMTRGSLVLFVLCGIVGVPTYVSGNATMWALTQPPKPEISKAVINAHRNIALLSLFGLAFTGGAAWVELWRTKYFGYFSKTSLTLVLAFAIVTLGVMAETGHRGGQINHPEIRVATEVLPTDPEAGVTPWVESTMNSVVWFIPWQTVHFFGYCLIFASVLALALRVLGFWRSMSFAAVHRLLMIGFLGVLMNVFSGMLMMLADSYRYVVGDMLFGPKMALITIGAAAVLYFSVSDRIWGLKAGEDAPMAAKWVAGFVLLAWTGVLVCGRLLPYI
jgi:uncharacterized membrane protein